MSLMRSVAFCTFTALLLSTLSLSQVSGSHGKREEFKNAEVIYGWVQDSAGRKLRTFTTRPLQAAGKVPAIFFVGWLSCDSVEYPDAQTRDGFGVFLRRMIDESGYATVRMDKPGVGESQGDCAKVDFATELSGYQAAFDEMLKLDFIDPSHVVVIGLSNGGGTAPLAAGSHPVLAYIAIGSWGRTWYEHMLELERRRMAEAGKPPAEINSSIKAFTEFYTLYLMKGMTPGEVIAKHPEWKALWYDESEGQYGRPAAFYQQLQALNLGEVWQKVKAPVLVIHGTSDTIMSALDGEAIAADVNLVHPGQASYIQIDRMTHGLTEEGKFYDPLIPTVLDWIKQQLAKQEPSRSE